LIVKAKAGTDIRETGSGGTGATNVSRRAGNAAGLLTLFLDATKGAVAVLLARTLIGSSAGITWTIGLAALAVLVGHIFPVWLGFRGGKGVATAVGVFGVLDPIVLIGAGLVFMATVLLTRYVSLASILATLTVPLSVWLQMRTNEAESSKQSVLFFTAVAAAALILFAHRSNIGRLLRGKETKFR